MSKIKDIDKGWNRIKSELKKTDNSSVTVGIHKDKKYKNGASVALIGATHEFGTDNAGKNRNIKIPERSFMRSTYDENKTYLFGLIGKLYEKILVGSTDTYTSLRTVGFQFSTMIQNKIEAIKTPSNKPSTIRRKKEIGDNPLIHTRKLKTSVDFEVTLR